MMQTPQHVAQHQRRFRTVLMLDQIAVLERAFEANKYPDAGFRRALALSINLDERRVQVWFQNQRAKQRKRERDMRTIATVAARLLAPGAIIDASSANTVGVGVGGLLMAAVSGATSASIDQHRYLEAEETAGSSRRKRPPTRYIAVDPELATQNNTQSSYQHHPQLNHHHYHHDQQRQQQQPQQLSYALSWPDANEDYQQQHMHDYNTHQNQNTWPQATLTTDSASDENDASRSLRATEGAF